MTREEVISLLLAPLPILMVNAYIKKNSELFFSQHTVNHDDTDDDDDMDMHSLSYLLIISSIHVFFIVEKRLT